MIPIDWLIYWIAVWGPLDFILSMWLLIWYRRYWKVIEILGLAGEAKKSAPKVVDWRKR